MENKYNLVTKAYTTMQKNGETIHILDTDNITDMATHNTILDIQRNLDVDFGISYEIMAEACDIISEKTLTGNDRNSLTGTDFYADADSRANVYTDIQLSYLSLYNEAEISDLMKDESITSIAQACSAWYTRKVVEACEALRDYIIA